METDESRTTDLPALKELELDGGGFVLYDPEDRHAWIQADSPVDLHSRT